MRALVPLLLLATGCLALDLSPAEMPWAIVDEPYTPAPLIAYGAARCPAGDASFSAQGPLPPGLSLSALGQITGVPLKIGVYRFAIRAADACSAASLLVTIVVMGAP